MPRLVNPFQVTRPPVGAEFCNRTRELEALQRAWETRGAKLVVYGDRRQGKSAVLTVAAERVAATGAKVVVFNLATAIDAQDAVQRLIRAVHRAIGRSWKSVVQDLAAKLRFNVTFTPKLDPSGFPEFTLGFEPGATPPTSALFADALDAIEAELLRRRLRLGLGIDEFQRLLKWGGEEIEWALKAVLERHTQISYVFAGSARTLIEEMVSNKNRALWKTVETLSLGPIPDDEFARWIHQRARHAGLTFGSGVPEQIIALAGPRTRDVILLAAAVWEDARARGGPGDPESALATEVGRAADLHIRVWSGRTDREQRLLRLIASDPATEPTAERVRRQYGLGPSSTVTKALSVLVDDEVLAKSGTRYHFDDPFFRWWVIGSTGEDIAPSISGLPSPQRR